MATNCWFLKFPSSRVYHLQGDSSDHRPLFIVFTPLDLPQRKKKKKKKPFDLKRCDCQTQVAKKPCKLPGIIQVGLIKVGGAEIFSVVFDKN